MKRIEFTKTQSGINNGSINVDNLGGFLFYNDKLPVEWLPGISDWVTGTDYVVGDKVYDPTSSNYYIANVIHTAAASFATDVAKWDVYTETVKLFTNLIEVESAGITKDSADFKLIHYQLQELYRINSEAYCYVYIVPETGNTYDFAELYSFIQQMPTGEKATVLSIFGDFPVTIDTPTNIQTQIDKIKNELSISLGGALFSGNYDAYTDVASILAVDFATLNAPQVVHILSQDGDAYGYSLQNKNLGAVGAALGAFTQSRVSDSIANYTNLLGSTYELRNPILPFGQIKIKSLNLIQKQALNDAKHIILDQFPYEAGTRLYNDKTCVADTNDYNYLNRNRVWDKIYRDVTTVMTPFINQKFAIVPGTGVLTPNSVIAINSAVETPLAKLVTSNDISNYRVQVKNTDNFAVTKRINIVLEITPVIQTEKITIALGFNVTT